MSYSTSDQEPEYWRLLSPRVPRPVASSALIPPRRMWPLPRRVILETASVSKSAMHNSCGSPMEAWTLSLLVLNFIPHPTKALDEMVRVARPGGTISGAVWDYGQGMEMLRIFWDEAVALNPAADARDERHMALSREGQLDALWRALRLQDVAEEALTIQTRFSSFDDYWLPFLERQGPAGDYVATLTVGEREQLRLRLRNRLLGDRPDGPIELRARAWAVRGIVP
jgi:SAM-dependent methyltransferase